MPPRFGASQRRRALAASVVLTVVAGCACSGHGSEATPTTERVAESARPGPVATTGPVIDATDRPTTTEPPETALHETDAFALDVEADLLETLRLTDDAFADPTNDAAVDAALAGHTNGNLSHITGAIERFRANNWVIRPNPEVPATRTVEIGARPARVNGRDGGAIVQVCEIDSWLTVEPGAGPNGSDVMIDPDVVARRTNFVLEAPHDDWVIVGGERLGEWLGRTRCPPAEGSSQRPPRGVSD